MPVCITSFFGPENSRRNFWELSFQPIRNRKDFRPEKCKAGRKSNIKKKVLGLSSIQFAGVPIVIVVFLVYLFHTYLVCLFAIIV